jgi:superfamily II DNA or RNA helicase
MVDRTRAALRTSRTVLIQLPTGGGKTAISGFMSGSAAGKGHRVAFLCHRRELVRQTCETYDRVGIPYGIIAAGFTGDRRQAVQICSIPTLAKRLDLAGDFNVMIWDEAHHIAAGTWAEIMAAFPNAKHIGLTATPERLDGTGLGRWFETLVSGPSVSWLIEQGFLAPYRLYAPPSDLDLTGVKRRGGDFAKDEVSARIAKSSITGDAVDHYTRLAAGRRAIAFCASIKHSVSVAEKFQAAGYTALHIDGTTEAGERDAALRAFAAGRIQVLTSVDLVSEGLDIPAIEVAILLRPTQSLGLYLQQVGRSLRPAPGKSEALVLDHAGNALRHGLPDDEREWSLAGRVKRKAGAGGGETAPPARQCPACFAVHAPAERCPRCGHEYPVLGRTIEQLEGELLEIDRATLAARAASQQRIEQGKAQTLDDLVRLARLRGYRNAHGWAQAVFKARQRKDAVKAAQGR